MNKRRTTLTVLVGDVAIGSSHPICVQSMTNTDTEDVEATAEQIRELAEAGSELVRITVNTPDAARVVPRIRELLAQKGCSIPLVGDFHYNGHQLLREFPDCAEALDKYRINPGTLGSARGRDDNFAQMIECAIRHDKSVRIGVNWGSLDQALLTQMMDENAKQEHPRDAHDVLLAAMVESALSSARTAEELGLARDKIVLSAKVSCVSDVVAVNRQLAVRCEYPLHIGLTEAGMGDKGIVASTAALSILLQEGIGDTIRVSLTPAPGDSRTREVDICQEVLQVLELRAFAPSISACPGCGRTDSALFMKLTEHITRHVKEQMPTWRLQYPGVENLQIAVMGCVVNGPGESKHADIGISLPGNGEDPRAPVFVDGEHFRTLSGPHIAEEFLDILQHYIAQRFRKE